MCQFIVIFRLFKTSSKYTKQNKNTPFQREGLTELEKSKIDSFRVKQGLQPRFFMMKLMIGYLGITALLAITFREKLAMKPIHKSFLYHHLENELIQELRYANEKVVINKTSIGGSYDGNFNCSIQFATKNNHGKAVFQTTTESEDLNDTIWTIKDAKIIYQNKGEEIIQKMEIESNSIFYGQTFKRRESIPIELDN